MIYNIPQIEYMLELYLVNYSIEPSALYVDAISTGISMVRELKESSPIHTHTHTRSYEIRTCTGRRKREKSPKKKLVTPIASSSPKCKKRKTAHIQQFFEDNPQKLIFLQALDMRSGL